MYKVYYIKSPNKTEIVVEDNLITIVPKGFMNSLNKGLSGEKTFKIRDIHSVQIKKPGLTNGYIQFGLLGDGKPSQGVFSAVSDENSVVFSNKYYDEMLELKQYIDSFEDNKSTKTENNSVADELIKLKQLFNDGILDEDEFKQLKKKLIN